MSLGCGQGTFDAGCFNIGSVPMSIDFNSNGPSFNYSSSNVSSVKSMAKEAGAAVSDNIIKPCVKGGAVGVITAKQALNKAPIAPHPVVQGDIIKKAAVAGCVAGIVDNGLEKTTGIGINSGIASLLKSSEVGEYTYTPIGVGFR